MAEKTLILLTPGFPKDEKDTTCIPFIQQFILSINKAHPELKIIALSFYYPFSSTQYSWHGNLIIPFNGNRFTKLKRPVHWWRIYRTLKKLNKQRKIIGIVSFWLSHTAFIGHHFAKRNNVQHYCWLRGQDAKKKNPVFRYYKPAPHSLIALSKYQHNVFIENYGITPKHIIPNAIRKEEFDHIIYQEKSIDIIGVGSLISLKRYELFIKTIEQLKHDFPNIKAVLVGDGDQRDFLMQLVKQKKLENNISFKGLLSHNEALQLMQQSKILLHPSEYEGYGRVCIESLYLGCEVVSFIDPEQKPIPRWHIVHSPGSMIDTCRNILLKKTSDTSQIKVNMMEDCINQVLELFEYSSNSISRKTNQSLAIS